MSIPAFGVRKPVVANLVMFTIIIGGIIFGVGLRREFFPEVNPTLVTIAAPYPGASPDEVEQALATKIEDAIDTLDDVKEISSTVSEGVASIAIEFDEGVDINQKVQDVKREMDALQDLPDEADRIIVDKLEPNLPTINVSLYGSVDERTMKRAIRLIKDDLESIDGMGDIGVSGIRRDEIRIEARPEALIKHRLSLPMVSDRVRAEMLELPGGTLKSSASNVAVRTLGAEERADQIRNIVVKAGDDGQVLKLADIADVQETFADVDVRSRLNGEPAFSLTVFKVGKQDAVTIAELVKAYVAGVKGEPLKLTVGERIATFAAGMRPAQEGQEPPAASQRIEAYELGLERGRSGGVPPGAQITVTTDLAKFIVGRLDLLTRNALYGGLLVFLVLMLLLNWRVSFWVAVGLIVSVLGTLAVMYFVGVTLNLLTMFGLIVVLGLLVDDAIVVAENITARHEAGEDHIEASIKGTKQVEWPVISTVMTTICAFLPLALIQGQIGDFLEVLPIVVACALAVSLIECLFILPAHMSHSLRATDRARAKTGGFNPVRWLESRTDRAREAFFGKFLIPFYTASLRVALRFRYISLAAAISVVIVSAGMVASGKVEFIFFESDDAETIDGQLVMPIGTPTAKTDEVLRRIEAACLNQPEIQQVFASAGSVTALDGESSSEQSHLAQVILEVMPVEQRQAQGLRESSEIMQAIRDELGPLPGVKSFRLEGVSGGPAGPPITLTVVGQNPQQIDATVARVKELIAEYPGVENISDNADRGQRELRFTLRPGANELGFTTSIVAQQIRGAVFGLEPYTFAGDEEDVDVRVTLPERVRRSIAALESLFLISPAGEPVPLREIVNIEEVEGYATVRRLDGKRAVTVTADVNRTVGNPETITAALAPRVEDLAASEPGIDILARGRQEDVADSFATLPLGMAVAAGLIFVILAWLFGSYTQPLVVMSAIPFATIGMIWGHFILGYSMTFLSLIGFVALAGVVVNDSLILMEFYNHERRRGLGVYDACMAAGRARVRAILLTTVTTVLGLTPLLLEQSFQAKFLIPMAITISGGLISATAIILIILPCLLLIFSDIGLLLRTAWTGRVVERGGPAGALEGISAEPEVTID